MSFLLWKQVLFLLIMSLAVVLVSHGWHQTSLPPDGIINHVPKALLSGAARRVFGKKILINQASQKDLLALPGIGPGRAQRILWWREKKGPFRRVEELQEVPGIGPKTFQGVAPLVKVTP